MGVSMVPVEHVLVLAGLLFVIGLFGLMLRRNIIFMLMALEVMLNSAALAFVAAGARWGQADGQVIFMFILAIAAAEVSVGLGLVLQMRRQLQSLDMNDAVKLKGLPLGYFADSRTHAPAHQRSVAAPVRAQHATDAGHGTGGRQCRSRRLIGIGIGLTVARQCRAHDRFALAMAIGR